MHRSRAISRRSCGRNISGCMLAILLAVNSLPAFALEEEPSAQNEEPSAEEAKSPIGEVRGVVSSGLGEWGLSQRFPDSALWLDMEDGSRTLALFWPETEAPARGALIILADEGENAASGLAGALARELATRKLAVLSLGLEAPPASLEQVLERPGSAPGTEATEPGRKAASPATIDVMAPETPVEMEAVYRSRIRNELSAAETLLEQRGYQLAGVVGIGRGSNHVVPFVAGLKTPAALIWVEPAFYPRDSDRLAEALESASVSRILELSSSEDRVRRKARLQRAGMEAFSLQPVAPGSASIPPDGKALASRISAWLKPDAR